MTERERVLEEEVARLREENRLLRQKLDLVIRQLFGRKSEKLDPGQLELLLSDLDGGPPGKDEASPADADAAALVEAEAKTTSRRRSHEPARGRLPEHLPVVEEILEPAPVQGCPEAWRRIGEEVSEQLDYEPGRFYRRRLIRPKYVRRSTLDTVPIIASLPPKLVEGGLLAPGLMAHIVVSKYADHLPLYRQEQIYRQRYGVELSRQTMANAITIVADWLEPIVRQMSREQFASGYVQIDETPVRYLSPGKGSTAQGYLWTCHRPGGDTVYHWHASRAAKCLEAIVPASFTGTLQCDGYAAYPALARKRDGIELAGCWAHLRRKFYHAFEQGECPQRSAWIVRQIAHLYRIEKELRQSRAGPTLREAVRQSQSRMVVERLHRVLTRLQSSRSHLPRSLMGQALAYALEQWPHMTHWLEDGRLEIDNNLVENAIRPTAVGRKNWLFIGSKEAGRRSAIIYSIITSCRNRGIDPLEYLRDVLTRLPSMTNWQIPEVTPQAWAAARQQRQRLAA